MLRVIIVDDQESIRKTVRAYLGQFEDQLTIVGEHPDGDSAIEFLKSSEVDVAILDINMPGMSGLEVAKFIHEENIATTPLIFSSYLNDKNVSSAINSEVRGIIDKDERGIESLVPAIKSLLNGDSVFSAKAAKLLAASYKKQSVSKGRDTKLSPREIEIIQFLFDEYTNKEIAEELKLSVRTVESHRKNIMAKLSLKTVSGLIRYAMENKLVN